MLNVLSSLIFVSVVVPLLIAIGIGVLSIVHPAYKIAYVCFTLAALILLLRVAWWLTFEHSVGKLHSVILAFLIFGFIGSLWLVTIKWVQGLQTQSRENVAQQEKKPIKKPSLHETFNKDFDTLLRSEQKRSIGVKDSDGAAEIMVKISEKAYLDFEGKSKFLGYYIPHSQFAYGICEYLPDIYKITMKELESKIEVIGGHVADSHQTSSRYLLFSGRIYIYHENNL